MTVETFPYEGVMFVAVAGGLLWSAIRKVERGDDDERHNLRGYFIFFAFGCAVLVLDLDLLAL